MKRERFYRHAFLTIAILIGFNWCLRAQSPGEPEKPAGAGESYRIRKGDKLSIKFLYQPELNEMSMTVRPDGLISLALLGEVRAEGLTATELREQLERAYAESLIRPVITVNILEFVPPRIFVGGQVLRAGSYDIRQGQTLLQAIILAGGFTRDAHRKLVLHARPIGKQQLKVTVVDLTRLLKQGATEHEVPLSDGDYIFVPDSKLSRLSRIIDVFRSFVPGYGLSI